MAKSATRLPADSNFAALAASGTLLAGGTAFVGLEPPAPAVASGALLDAGAPDFVASGGLPPPAAAAFADPRCLFGLASTSLTTAWRRLPELGRRHPFPRGHARPHQLSSKTIRNPKSSHSST